MSIGIWQLVIILAIILILFGRGKISQIMGEFGKGINSFKKEIKNQQQDKADKISQDSDRNSLKNLDKKSKTSHK